ncbi:MAG: metallophosphoesterase [Chloroflexota bacterium]
MPTATDPLRFLHISDTHINPDRTYNKDYARYTPMLGVEAMVREINALPFTPDFILHTGDVAFDPAPDVYLAVKEALADLDAPIHYLVGNHDDSLAFQRDLIGRADEAISDYYYYELETKGVQIVCLDSNGPHDAEKPTGNIPDEELEWLRVICGSDDPRPLVIATHHSVLPVYVPWLDIWMHTENGEVLHAVIKQASHRLCGVFHGHIHQNIQVMRDNVTYISVGSTWCQFKSYPDPSNEHIVNDMHTLPSFNMVTITDTTTSVIRHSFTVEDN